MKRQDYVLEQAKIYKKLCDQRDKKSAINLFDLTPKAAQKLSVDQNWRGMDIEKTKERMAFALGFLAPNECREYYEPSGWHKYKGIEQELEHLAFER